MDRRRSFYQLFATVYFLYDAVGWDNHIFCEICKVFKNNMGKHFKMVALFLMYLKMYKKGGYFKKSVEKNFVFLCEKCSHGYPSLIHINQLRICNSESQGCHGNSLSPD